MEHNLSRLPDTDQQVMQALWDAVPWLACTLTPALQPDRKIFPLRKLTFRLEECGFVKKGGGE